LLSLRLKNKKVPLTAIDNLIEQIDDKVLSERLKNEVNRITKEKKFGLVFEEHLPELTPVYNHVVRKGCKVALKGTSLVDIWLVKAVSGNTAQCIHSILGKETQFQIQDLVVVRQFGEAIFPTLTSIEKLQNTSEGELWHILIEAENFHALQLLGYLYEGQVDCIYIDPPYNTGARDWKYNNDYVDGNDSWRHSKWLSMMKRRLLLAKRLLHPKKGVLIVTIDEHEMHHLRVLLSQLFPNFYIQMVTSVTNPKGVTQGRFSRVEEYLLYCFASDAFVAGSNDNLLNPVIANRKPRWKGLLRSGTNARRVDRKNMFYPVLIDEKKRKIVGAGDSLPYEQNPTIGEKIDGYTTAWPIRTDGSYGNWGVGFVTLRKLIEKGYVACGKYDKKRKTYGISYISEPSQKLIESGDIAITGRDPVTDVVEIKYMNDQNRTVKTIWHRSRHDAGAYGSDFLRKVLDPSATFPFPKSIYSVKDAISSVVRNNKEAMILDFFAGSGTTLNAVNLINYADDGHRRCIMVTNNEVSSEESAFFQKNGIRAGDDAWEKQGICQSVTWPRTKYTILGKRDDNSLLDGDYFTGRSVEKATKRRFHQISFTATEKLCTITQKKQLVALFGKENLPQSLAKKDSAFIVSEKHTSSILFDENRIDDWLDALDDKDHITDFYIVTAKKSSFEDAKNRINDLLGLMVIVEDEMLPLSKGFAANVEYFRLDYLDKDKVTLGKQFREILPILWLRAGAIGPRPEIAKNKPSPAMLLPELNPFAVLVDETRFADFLKELERKETYTHIYLVTDSEEAFQEMATQISAPNVIQLYRDYLENFVINKMRKN
jgi:adenine-specific DNA-methyltransferase